MADTCLPGVYVLSAPASPCAFFQILRDPRLTCARGRPSPAESQLLNSLIQSQTVSNLTPTARSDQIQIHSLLESDLATPLPLHISLSRSLVLQTHQREQFLERLTTSVRSASVRPFTITFSSLAWYPNHDHTRWFLSLSADRPGKDELNRLLKACNTTAAVSQQPTLYQPEQDSSQFFHVSLAWSLTQPSAAPIALDTDDLQPLSALFDALKAKIGNNITTLTL